MIDQQQALIRNQHYWGKARGHSKRRRFLLHPPLLALPSGPGLATSAYEKFEREKSIINQFVCNLLQQENNNRNNNVHSLQRAGLFTVWIEEI